MWPYHPVVGLSGVSSSYLFPGSLRSWLALGGCLLRGAMALRCGRGVVQCLPDVAHLGPVLQEPAVGHLVLPAHVPGVLPQQPDLVTGVPRVP